MTLAFTRDRTRCLLAICWKTLLDESIEDRLKEVAPMTGKPTTQTAASRQPVELPLGANHKYSPARTNVKAKGGAVNWCGDTSGHRCRY